MNPLHVLSIQSTLSLIAFALIARWHVAPRLSLLPREEALVPLLWVQVFRYAPLTLYAPGQVDSRIPADVAATVALGDLAAGLLALVALVALKLRMSGAVALIWVFSAVGIGDLVLATLKAVRAEMYTFAMGWNWYILNFYVPLLVVSHTMIVRHLVRGLSARRRESSDCNPRSRRSWRPSGGSDGTGESWTHSDGA